MEVIRLEKYKKISPSEGMFLTTYVDGDDVLKYNSATMIYCPLTTDESIYREIDAETNDAYMAAKAEAEKKLQEEMEKKNDEE